MKRFYLILSLVAMLFISCEGDFGEGGNTDFGNITLDENATELLNQTLEGDALSGAGITFTANAAWSATVREVRSGASWLTISPDHGEAGTYTLSITLEANDTGASRSAEIIISCDGSTLKIKITQKAAEQVTPPAPTIDAKNRITAIFFREDDDEGYEDRALFTYNDKGNIASIKYEHISDYKLVREITQTINYDGRNVTIPEMGYYLNKQVYPQPHSFRVKEEYTDGTAILNSDGTLSSYNYDGEVFNISYGKDGRVDKYTNEQSEAVALFTWENGNLTGIYTDELETTITINYSDKENICGGVDWLWLLINSYDCSEEFMPLALLNKNGGLHTKNLPQSFSANGRTIELTYTFDEQERIESVTFYGVTYVFGYNDDTFVSYEWAPYVTKQEIVNYYNEINSGDLGYNRHCVVRTYSGKDNYFDHTYTQSYTFYDIDGCLFIGPEYKSVEVVMKSEDDYTNAKYRGSYTEPYIDEWEREANYVYYDFTTFMARGGYRLELRIEEQFSLYDATTGEHVATKFPNEEWVPYFKLVETDRSKNGAGEGTDENGVPGVLQYYTIACDMYVTFSRKDADPTKLNYILYNSCFFTMTHWIPNKQ